MGLVTMFFTLFFKRGAANLQQGAVRSMGTRQTVEGTGGADPTGQEAESEVPGSTRPGSVRQSSRSERGRRAEWHTGRVQG